MKNHTPYIAFVFFDDANRKITQVNRLARGEACKVGEIWLFDPVKMPCASSRYELWGDTNPNVEIEPVYALVNGSFSGLLNLEFGGYSGTPELPPFRNLHFDGYSDI